MALAEDEIVRLIRLLRDDTIWLGVDIPHDIRLTCFGSFHKKLASKNVGESTKSDTQLIRTVHYSAVTLSKISLRISDLKTNERGCR